MNIDRLPVLRWLLVPYTPDPSRRGFLERAQTQVSDGVEVTVAVLDSAESRRFFGVPLARRGIQPVWLRIANHTDSPVRLNLIGIDPNYFSPHEAAGANHFSTGKRLLEFGLLAWIFLPFILLLPLKLIFARRSNRRMDEFFQQQAFRLRPVPPAGVSEGFVFTPLDAGTKIVHVDLLGHAGTKEFVFSVPVPGLAADYEHRDLRDKIAAAKRVECDARQLTAHLGQMAATTSNGKGNRTGDPVNLVVVGEFPTILSAFGARWDETEVINWATCWKTFRAFLTGGQYRYSPVSALFLFGRCQDFALQRIRHSINDRLHLRLWLTPYLLHGAPVWVGQVSRDIGVRFTWRTWNLTTHRIDPDVDEARDYVVEDLLQAGRLEMAGYVDGVGESTPEAPRHNLTGDPFFTDGKRAAVVVAPARTAPRFIAWA